MFEVVYKKSYFSSQTVKLIVKVCLILCTGLTGAWNHNLILLSDLFQHHKSNDRLRIDKQASVENRIFQCKHYYLGLCEILIF